MCVCQAHGWRSEDVLLTSFSSLHHVDSGDQIQIAKLGSKGLYLLSHPSCFVFLNNCKNKQKELFLFALVAHEDLVRFTSHRAHRTEPRL